jgi:class 3 adenylate cyclase
MTNPAAADDLERKLATILSADVAAYSRLMAEDEEGTLQTFRGHKEVFEKLVQLHRGRIFNTAGDSILAEFGSAVEAVRCATEIQAALRTRNDQLAEARRVKFRIGINVGDVITQGADLLGDGVNVAARLQVAAAPGGICIAGSVYDQILNKLSLSFKPLGEISYKNIPQPVRTFAIAAAEGAGELPSPKGRPRFQIGRPVVAAMMLLVAAGSAFWVHSHQRQHSGPEYSLASEVAAQRQALIEQRRVERAARHLAKTSSKLEDAAQSPTTAASEAVQSPPQPAPPTPMSDTAAAGNAADLSGLYRGQICYGANGPTEPARCFQAQAVVLRNRIAGEWPGRIRGVTIYLSGRISGSGEVAIHMHSKRADGSRFAVSDMIGSLHDGRIEARGSFNDGRSVTLSWRKE